MDPAGLTIIVGETGGAQGQGDTEPSAGAAPGSAGVRLDLPFGRYLLIRRIGAGGMGVVYEAWDPELGRAVALKQLRPDAAGGADARARFQREARLAARLRHPHVVPIHDVGEVGDTPYITMDFIAGRSFASLLEEDRTAGRAGPAWAARLRERIAGLAEVAGAIAHAHAHGVIHRDLKPANILIDGAGQAWVTDFGLAKESAAELAPGDTRADRLTKTGEVLGTPAYMCPEQIFGGTSIVGPPADVWALGAMLYEVLVGTTPFGGSGSLEGLLAGILRDDPAPPRARNREVPAELETLCLRALEKNPALRRLGAADLEADLLRWLRGEPLATRPASTLERARRWAGRRKVALLACAAVALLVPAALHWGADSRATARARAQTTLLQIGRAVEEFEDAAMRTPMTAEARAQLARQPLGLLESLVAEFPDSGPAFAWRARVRAALGQDDGARADFDRACELSPEQAVVWYLRGMEEIEGYAHRRKRPMTIQGANGFETLPAPEETAGERSLRERGLDDLARALKVGASDPSLEGARIRLGRALAQTYGDTPGGCGRALNELEGLELPRSWRLRGQALAQLDRFAESADACRRAVTSWPEDPVSRLNFAFALCALADVDRRTGKDAQPRLREAISQLNETLRLDPENWLVVGTLGNAWGNLGGAQSECGEDGRASQHRAIDAYTRILETVPDDPTLLESRATAWMHLGEAERDRGSDPSESFRRAVEDCDRALRIRPVTPSTLTYRALARMRQGKWAGKTGAEYRTLFESALADVGEAIRREPEDAYHRVNRGAVLEALASAEHGAGLDARERYRRAIADLTIGVQAHPGSASMLLFRGEALAELALAEREAGGDPQAELDRAIADLDESLRIDPHGVRALYARGEAHRTRASVATARGADPRDVLRASLADLDLAHSLSAGDASVVVRRGMTLVDLARAQAPRGEDPQETYRSAIADLDASVRDDPQEIAGWHSRGIARLDLAEILAGNGRDPQAEYAGAEADYGEVIRRRPRLANGYEGRGNARRSLALWRRRQGRDFRPLLEQACTDLGSALTIGGGPNAHAYLGMVLRALLRFDEAIAEFEAYARVAPGMSAWARARIEETRPAQAEIARWAKEPNGWSNELAEGEKMLGTGKDGEAREFLERGLESAESLPSAWSRAEIARFVIANYNLACVLSLASSGRSAPNAAAMPLPAEEAAALRDRAFARLGRAVDHGWRDRAHVEADADLAPLREDPRWSALLERMK